VLLYLDSLPLLEPCIFRRQSSGVCTILSNSYVTSIVPGLRPVELSISLTPSPLPVCFYNLPNATMRISPCLLRTRDLNINHILSRSLVHTSDVTYLIMLHD